MRKRLLSILCLAAALGACGENAPPGEGGQNDAGQAGKAPSAGWNSGGSAGTTPTSGAGGASSGGSGGSAGGGTASSGGASGRAGSNAAGGSSGSAGGANMSGGAGGSRAGSSNGGEANGGAAGSASGSGGAPAAGASGAGASPGGSAGMSGASAGGAGSGCGPVTPVPDEVRERLDLDPFYEKHVDANGLSVLSSGEPSDESLILACELLNNMLGQRDDVRAELIRRGARFAIIGKDEGTAEIPEYGYGDATQEEIDYINQRARGLGGIVASCGEENILCLQGDRYYNESICVHEFSHTISMYGTERAFRDELEAAYDSALASGILDDTYRTSNSQEYWAEGVQDWYDTNASSNPPNGVHNDVNTRVELAEFDPTLYALIGEMFPEATAWGDCHAAE